MKVKYYKQKINTHRVNQIGERERERIRDLWAETVVGDESGLDGSGDEGENHGLQRLQREKILGRGQSGINQKQNKL